MGSEKKAILLAAAASAASATLASLALAGAERPPGLLVFATQGNGLSARQELAVVRPDGSGFRRLTRQVPQAFDARWTSDGRRIVFSSLGGAGWSYWRMDARGRRLQQIGGHLHGDTNADEPSPSGTRVARFRGVRLTLVTARGRRLHSMRWRRGDTFGGAIWSPDERHIAVELVLRDRHGTFLGTRTVVVATRRPMRVRALPRRRVEAPVAWSPDGRTLIGAGRAGFHAVHFDGRRPRRLGVLPRFVWALTWAPDNRRIAWVDRRGGIFVAHAFGSRARRIGRTPLEDSPSDDVEVAIGWSPTRDELAVWDLDRISLLRLDGRKRLLARIRNVFHPVAWSPDGTRLVFGRGGDVMTLSRAGRLRRLLDAHFPDSSPKWSPDGSRIAFVRDGVYVSRADGRGARRLAAGFDPIWSPVGSKLAFTDARGIVVLDLATGKRTRVTMGEDFDLAWSPDGTALALVRDESGDGIVYRVYIARVEGGELRALLPPDASETSYSGPAWSRGGSTIVVAASTYDDETDDFQDSVVLVDVRTGATRHLLATSALSATGGDAFFDWSPDGSQIAFAANQGPIGVMRADGSSRRTIARNPSGAPAWSPDGARLAFVACRGGEEMCDVYVADRDGSNRRRVTRTRGNESGVDWASRVRIDGVPRRAAERRRAFGRHGSQARAGKRIAGGAASASAMPAEGGDRTVRP